MVNGLLHNEQAFAVLIMGFIDLHIVAACSCACILGVINSHRSLRSSQLALHRALQVASLRSYRFSLTFVEPLKFMRVSIVFIQVRLQHNPKMDGTFLV